MDSAVLSRLVEILKFSTPNLQRKASSILEFIIITDPSMDYLNKVDIESGLDAVFQQKILKGKKNGLTIRTLVSIKSYYGDPVSFPVYY